VAAPDVGSFDPERRVRPHLIEGFRYQESATGDGPPSHEVSEFMFNLASQVGRLARSRWRRWRSRAQYVDQAFDQTDRVPAAGAKLGAIPRGFPRAAVDSGGLGSPSFRLGWTAVDPYGRRLEIYGLEGWGFGSFRACCRNPSKYRGIAAWARRPSDGWEPFGLPTMSIRQITSTSRPRSMWRSMRDWDQWRR